MEVVMKVKTLKVEYQLSNSKFRVVQVTDSVEPVIGHNLTKDQVDGYCHHREWKVTIVGSK
jgi:hypothetical protein